MEDSFFFFFFSISSLYLFSLLLCVCVQNTASGKATSSSLLEEKEETRRRRRRTKSGASMQQLLRGDGPGGGLNPAKNSQMFLKQREEQRSILHQYEKQRKNFDQKLNHEKFITDTAFIEKVNSDPIGSWTAKHYGHTFEQLTHGDLRKMLGAFLKHDLVVDLCYDTSSNHQLSLGGLFFFSFFSSVYYYIILFFNILRSTKISNRREECISIPKNEGSVVR